MALFKRIFGTGDDAGGPTNIDVARKRLELTELSAALAALSAAMRADVHPLDNPGWQGRIRDVAQARVDADKLHARATFDRQDLFDFGTTVRPLYRGQPPQEYRALADENERVVRALDALLA